MEVHIVHSRNERHYRDELRQNAIHRHRVFVEQLGWESLRKADGHEADEYDTDDATNLLLIKEGLVAGGLRLTPLERPTLLMEHFSGMVTLPFPDAVARGADWTRFYVTGRPQRLGPYSPSGALFCSAMDFALEQGWTFLTFVSRLAMLEMLLSIGWRVSPLGCPQSIDGQLCIAAAITVNEDSLLRSRAFMGVSDTFLADRSSTTRPSQSGDLGSPHWA